MKKKGLRFYFTIITVKIAAKLMKLIGKNGTHLPGWIANKMCPNFLQYMEKPEKLFYITGTNGKTTVTNIISDALKLNGYKFAGNAEGSNLNSGIITALLPMTAISGKSKCKLAIMEVDERYSPKIFPYMAPDYLVCTNLFRDSCKRNAHAEFIRDILDGQIPKHTKMILNGEDLISNHLAWGNERCYFGINCEDGHSSSNNIIKDIVSCPKCGSKLDYEYTRYHHIGKAHCPNCEFGSPELDYSVETIDYEKGYCTVNTPNGNYDIKLIGNNVTDIYNMITAVAVLTEIGLSNEEIIKSFESAKLEATRFASENICGKEVIMQLAKGQNPIACSRVCDFISHESGDKCILLVEDDYYAMKDSSENIQWIFDIDWEFLKDDSIKQIVIGGVRHKDFELRLLMAGIEPEKMICCEKETEVAGYADVNNAEKFYILYNVYTIDDANVVHKELIEKIKTEVK